MVNIVTSTWTIRDAKGRTSRHILYTDMDSENWSSVNSNVIPIILNYFYEVTRRLDAVITGAIVNWSVTLSPGLPPDIKTTPEINSDVEEGGLFKYPAGGTSAPFRNTLPTFDHVYFGNGTTINGAPIAPIPDELGALTFLLIQSSDAPDWPEEYGFITDNRGVEVGNFPLIIKKFKPSRK